MLTIQYQGRMIKPDNRLPPPQSLSLQASIKKICGKMKTFSKKLIM